MTVEELASHSHTFTLDSPKTGANTTKGNWFVDAGTLGESDPEYIDRTTNATGGNKPHSNLQPSYSTYMWKRVS